MTGIVVIDSKQKEYKFFDLPREVIAHRKLLYSLGKNDFKQRFAGSYLGIFWAFIQPIITVFVYWFVFEMALNVGAQSTKAGIEAPYVLWLLGGLVPWFFFSDALQSGAGSLLAYSYLVKKVVFKISILPVVKVFSSLYVHLFFVVFTIAIYSAYGFFPTIYTIQLLYYFFAMLCLVIGLVYFCSAITVLFRDMTQLISIALSVLVWMTPIMWNLNGMIAAGRVPNALLLLLEANPMFYIVQGYRDALLEGQWFFEHPGQTLYFWILTIVCFWAGTLVFEKLTPVFADVM